MLTELDAQVRAAVNVHAVLGTLLRLCELDPKAAELTAGVRPGTVLTLAVRGGPTAHYRFGPNRISVTATGGFGPRLLFTSPGHLEAVLAGTAQPIPLAGPAGIRFLAKVFTPLTELLGAYLQPTPEALADPRFAEISTLLTLHVAALAITVVGNEDVSGRFSADHMADGDLDLEIGDDLRYRIRVSGHRLRLIDNLAGSPRAAMRFADLVVAGDILAGRESALTCVCDGRLTMRGFIPLIDNTNRILDRVGAYLGAA